MNILSTSITIVWDNPEQTALLLTYTEGWKPEDFLVVLDQVYQMIDTSAGKVDLIHDVRESRRPPARMMSLITYVKAKRHPRQGFHVVVGGTAFMRALTEVASKFIPQAKNVLFVSDIDDARSLLSKKRNRSHGNGNNGSMTGV